MGRHRSDPRGLGRILVIGLPILALLALIAFGFLSVIGSLIPQDPAADGATATEQGEGSAGEDPAGDPESSASRQAGNVPTIEIECLAQVCPVFLRVPGGDVLVDRDLERGEKATYYEPRIDVVLNDAGAVRVLVNGEERERGEEGERQTFTAERAGSSPSPASG